LDTPAAPLIVILGPTGSGKSDLALEVAYAFDGEVVNCDSLQVYRFFDIGTAKLPERERRGIPHHLIDIVDPDQSFTAGDYARVARPLLSAITVRGKLPVVAGGTGFYLRALLDGLFAAPEADSEVRRRLQSRESRAPGSLHRLLCRLDPAAAILIHANDTKKIIRALEIRLLTGEPITGLHKQGRDRLEGYKVIKIGLSPPRHDLYQKLNSRCEAMFASGLLDEVRRILAMGYSPSAKPFESHGYKQALQHIQGALTLEEAVEDAKQNTRRYAKRQLTWYSRESGVQWFRTFGTETSTRDEVLKLIPGH
jgi:tRNA dimethylallyltransferase